MKSNISDHLHEKQYVIKTAQALFTRYGIKSKSFCDFIRHSQKTISKYFTNKKELVKAVLDDLIERNRRDLENIEKASENAVDQISKVSFLISRNLEEINPAFLFNLRSFHKATWKKYLKYFNAYFLVYFERALIKGKQEKYFRNDIDEKLIARVYWVLISLPVEKKAFNSFKINKAQYPSDELHFEVL
jgi:AcrR family transcriptional regulator